MQRASLVANAQISNCRELVLKIAAKHPEAAGIGIMLKEAVGLGLATPPGLSGFAGARPSPSPVVRLFSFALPKGTAQIEVEIDGVTHQVPDSPGQCFDPQKLAAAHCASSALRCNRPSTTNQAGLGPQRR